jgi:tetratricopeptide (TPR) repeat protein
MPKFKTLSFIFAAILLALHCGACTHPLTELTPEEEATAGDPAKFIALLEDHAKTKPEKYISLEQYCVFHNREAEACKYFEEARAVCPEPIFMANKCDWAIYYYQTHNQPEKAKELAEFAVQIYSQRGLTAATHYYERTGNLEEAEKICREIIDRYQSYRELDAFLLRHSDSNPAYAEEAKKLIRPFFPAGLKRVTMADFSGPPSAGMRIIDPDPLFVVPLLQKGMIIVAMNGVAIGSEDQFDIARRLSSDQQFHMIVWDGKQYQQVTKPIVNNDMLRIGVEVFSR